MSNARPRDESVQVPPAVKAAAARSRKAYEEVYKKGEEGETPPQEATPPAKEGALQEQPAQQTQERPQEAAPAPEPTAEQPKTEEQAPSASKEATPESKGEQSFEHQYRSMKGRYERANKQIEELTSEIASLHNLISTMQTTPAKGEESTTSVERLITPDEEADYGEEFLTVVGKKAKEELLPIIGKYEQKIAELESRLAGVNNHVTLDARERMLSTLDNRIPNWRELNTNQEFLDWLKLPDPYSGAIRHNLLKAAYEQNNAPRVAAFFQGFLADEAAVAPATGGATQQAETPPSPKVSLEELAAPGRAKTAAATAPVEKPIVTRAQIAEFYRDVAAGKYRGKPKEKAAFERVIFEAQHDGRIR